MKGESSLRLDIANRLDTLNESLDRLDDFLEREGIALKLAYIIRLAFEELVTNTIKYGYDNHGEHHKYHIGVLLTLGSPATMIIEDDGHPFNPLTDAPQPDLEASAENHPIGGLGLHMVRTMTVSLDYQRDGGINRLKVVFPNRDAQ